MRRQGFLYATFAIFLLGLISMSILVPLHIDAPDRSTTSSRVDELYFFTESVHDDIERASSIIGRRALVAATNGVVDNETSLSNPSATIAEAFLNGTVGGNTSQIMVDSTFPDWTSAMEGQAAIENYDINISTSLSQISIDETGAFDVQFTINHSFEIEDTRIDTGFDEGWRETQTMIDTEGVDDALLIIETRGRRFNRYQACEDIGAEVVSSGTGFEYNDTSNGTERTWTSGDAYQFTGASLDGIDKKPENVLVTDDLCNYDVNSLDRFSGVVSEATTDGTDVCGSGEEIDAYIGGIADRTTIANETRVVMNDADVWEQYIPDMINNRCYFADSTGPSFLDRMAGNYTSTTHGIGSLLDVPDLPPELQESNTSAVDHVYFDSESDAGTTHAIKGISNHQEWFVLDDVHVDQWNLTELTY